MPGPRRGIVVPALFLGSRDPHHRRPWLPLDICPRYDISGMHPLREAFATLAMPTNRA
jgi:hypothetical protein